MADVNNHDFFNDYGDNPLCQKVPDERYLMRFEGLDDTIQWCAYCGPSAHRMNAALNKAFAERGEDFIVKLGAAVTQAEKEQTRQ